MALYVKDAGTWKEATPYVKDGGSWKEITNLYVKDAGSWKEVTTSSPAYTYTIVPASLSGGKTIDGSFTLSPEPLGAVSWLMYYASSNPPGFWFSNTSSTLTENGDPAIMRSVSKDASSGTLVSITYDIQASVNGGTDVEPRQVTFLHQF